MNITKYTLAEWQTEARRRFGDDSSKWAFICPICKHVATTEDYQMAGAPEGAIAFSCIGRWIEGSKDTFGGEGKGPCNYTGGGLFRLNPVRVTDPEDREHQMFDFADAPARTE